VASRFYLMPQSAVNVGSSFPELGRDGQERFYLAFAAGATNTCEWTVPAPADWDTASAPTARVCIRMATATTNDIDLDMQVEAISDCDALDTDTTSSFDTVNSTDNTTVPGTAGYIDIITITLTNHDSSVAGDMLRFRFNRDGVSDTAAGNMEVLWIEIQDAA